MKVAVKKSTTKTTNANNEDSAVSFEEQISRRAYELYERRGRQTGHDAEDWLQAEAELARERTSPLAANAVKNNRKPPVTKSGKSKAKQAKNAAIVDAE